MPGSLRALWLRVNASYWFLPTILTILAFLLSLLTIYADRSGGSQWLSFLDWYEPSQPDGARAQLTVIAGAMMAIASTVFAITIAAVVYASGNYGPRLLTNFMTDRGNQVSLGVFIATFVYNLMILRVVRDPDTGAANPAEAAAFVPQISILVSAFTAFVAVGVLVFFLHHIPASIRINSVLGDIGRKLIGDIDKRFPDKAGSAAPPPAFGGLEIVARDTGYIEMIDFARLDEIAKGANARIGLTVRTGDFVHPHVPLGTLDGGGGQDVHERIRACFALGIARSASQDLEYLIDELVEIALRALSPGINDPFTAITSMHWMAAALAILADRDLTAGPDRQSYDPARVRPVIDDFDHFVRRSFGGVRASAAANAIASLVYLDALAGVARAASPERRAIVIAEARLLVRQARTSLSGPSLEILEERLANVERV